MIRFVIRRFFWGVPVLLIVATITFGILHAVPGGPFDQEKKLPPEIQANVEAKYHLDQPLWRQYFLYLGGLVQGDLGPSYKYLGRSVTDIISDTFPVSMQLGLFAVLLAVSLGVLTGIIAANNPDSGWDRLLMFLSTIGIAIPSFVLSAFLILVFAHLYHFFPPALWEGPRYAILPAFSLALLPAAYISRLTRASILEVAGKEYIQAARAKGLGWRQVVLKHVLKNSMTPVISYLGPLTAALVTGSFVVEFIFSIPGMGKFFITAVTNRDYPLIMGVTLVYAVLIILANLVVDVLYAILDPRIRLE
jgi:oligopeptide transport system permease protein